MIKVSFNLDVSFCELLFGVIGMSAAVGVIRCLPNNKNKKFVDNSNADRVSENSKKSNQKIQTDPKLIPKYTHSVVSNKIDVVKRTSKDHSNTFNFSNDDTDISNDSVENSNGGFGLSPAVMLQKDGENVCSSQLTVITGLSDQKLLCNNNQSCKSECHIDSSSEECKN